jgi:ABC-type branched-subunit amino acid transport system ATPase component
VEQNLSSALAVTDRADVLETCKVVHEAEAAELAEDPQWLVRFLGVH